MPLISKKVFLAPDVLLAFIDRNHSKHDQASAFFRYFALEGYHLSTDLLSMNDTYHIIASTISPSIAKDFLRTVMASNITIIYPDESDTKAAMKLYANDKSNEIPFQKALMAVLADRRGIGQIATFEYFHAMFGLSMFYIPL